MSAQACRQPCAAPTRRLPTRQQRRVRGRLRKHHPKRPDGDARGADDDRPGDGDVSNPLSSLDGSSSEGLMQDIELA